MVRDSSTVEAAYEWCETLTRRKARNFYYGLKLSPPTQRRALYALYAWMRRADDLVDDNHGSVDSCLERISRFRSATDVVLGGDYPDESPLWVALWDTSQRFALTPAHFHSMLDGQIDDVENRPYRTFTDLREYCYRVASTVGLLCLEIWGSHDDRAGQFAIDRGIAFQLTNILRDFREDFDAGRVYLPDEDFLRHEITPEELRGWARPDRGRAFLLDQINRAESYYRRSAALDEVVGEGGRSSLWAMTSIYHQILVKMRRHPERIVLGDRMRLNALHKGAIAVRARWGHHAKQAAAR